MTDTHRAFSSPSRDLAYDTELQKPSCPSPSFSELSQNTTLDEDGIEASMGRSESKINLSSANSSIPTVTPISRGFGELLVSMKDGGTSPHSSNATDSSSIDEEAGKQCKMELSYSPTPLKTESTATEEANMLIELSASGRKAGRSNSYCETADRTHRLALDVSAAAAVEEGGDLGTNSSCLNNLLLLKTLPEQSLASPLVTRQRSSTFAATSSRLMMMPHSAGAVSNLSSSNSNNSNKTPMAALTWLASMEVDDLDVANSLFELSGHSFREEEEEEQEEGSDEVEGSDEYCEVSYEEEEEEEEEVEEQEELLAGGGRIKRYSHRNVELLLPGEEYHIRSSSIKKKLSQKSVAVPMSSNSNIVSRSASGALVGSGRARSYSMSYLHRSSGSSSNSHDLRGGAFTTTSTNSSASAASSAVHHLVAANNVMRGRSDPLSKALKRFQDNKAAFGGPGEGYIGIYSPEDRKERIQRFLEKRKQRMWTKKVKYDVRKNFADSRVRVKGRFVKKEEEEGAMK